jgi:hypothetical protein
MIPEKESAHIKYSGINVTKGALDVYAENYKTFLRKIKKI